MALYVYQAFSRDGKKVSGSMDAASSKLVREQLVRSGLFVVSIAQAKEAPTSVGGFKKLFEGSISVKDKIFFTKQLSVLLRSGVPLVDALSLLVEQSEGKLKTVTVALRDGIKEGRSLADGMAFYPKIFETLYVQLVRAGEASGRLELILERLTQYLERRAELNRKIRGALTQPIIQLVVIGIVVIGLLKFVVPQLEAVFAESGKQLPLPTRIVLSMSYVLQHYWILMFAGLIAIYVGYRFWKASPSGARKLDILKLHIPQVKYFARMGAVVRFSRTLGMLLEGGVNLDESLDIVCKIVDNRILAEALLEAKEQIVKQGKVAEYLKKTGLFPPLAIYLINTGEQSGKLDVMLTAVADQYETEMGERTDGLSKVLNPAMLVVMALVVVFVILAIMMPIMGLGDIAGA